MESSGLHIISHEPERRRRQVLNLACGGSTCCCCCCLHSLGGLIGSAVAPAFGQGSRLPIYYYYDEELDEDVPYTIKPGISAVALYWWIFLGVILLSPMLILPFFAEGWGPESLLVGLVILALVLPAVQFGVGIIVLIVLACMQRPDKTFQLWRLGKIMLGLVVGTIAGILAMVAIGLAMSRG